MEYCGLLRSPTIVFWWSTITFTDTVDTSSTPTFQNSKQMHQINLRKNKIKNKLRINSLQVRNMKETNKLLHRNSFLMYFSPISFWFLQEEHRQWRAENRERKQIQMPFCICTCLDQAFLLKLKGVKSFQIRKVACSAQV